MKQQVEIVEEHGEDENETPTVAFGQHQRTGTAASTTTPSTADDDDEELIRDINLTDSQLEMEDDVPLLSFDGAGVGLMII